MSRKPLIGLTGGIASGKSAVSKLLAARGVAVIDADRIAREVVAPGSDGLQAIVAQFGSGVLAADGGLDRAALAKRVFGDPAARRTLEGITHPRIAQLSAKRMQELQQSDAPYIVYDAPLLIETGAHKGMDAVIVVASSPKTQVARVQARDGMSAQDAEQRIAAQLPVREKVALADYVIENEGSLEQLAERTLAVHAAIVERFGLTKEASAS